MLNLYGVVLGVFVVALIGWDFYMFRKQRGRYFLIELIALGAALPFVFAPQLSQAVANAVGVGRGVDVLMYPLVLWLLRESIVSRQKRWQDNQRLTELVRSLAIREASTQQRPE